MTQFNLEDTYENIVIDMTSAMLFAAEICDLDYCCEQFDVPVNSLDKETLFMMLILEYENLGYDASIRLLSNKKFEFRISWTDYVQNTDTHHAFLDAGNQLYAHNITPLRHHVSRLSFFPPYKDSIVNYLYVGFINIITMIGRMLYIC